MCLTGYGGFGVSLTPALLSAVSPLSTRGVCFVAVNLRGGGEYGEAWHQAGTLTHKQNVFDDFARRAADLVAQQLHEHRAPRRSTAARTAAC